MLKIVLGPAPRGVERTVDKNQGRPALAGGGRGDKGHDLRQSAAAQIDGLSRRGGAIARRGSQPVPDDRACPPRDPRGEPKAPSEPE